MRSWRLLATLCLPLIPPPAAAQGIQRFADLGTCTTASGPPVLDCRVGYRTFGRLNAARDNAVLVPTWHGGRSETMVSLLGAGAWIDTTRYFAILMDAPGNGVSTSPSNSLHQPGARFPRLALTDMVAAQHRVVTGELGLRRLHAVVGWSMGGMQAIAWAQGYPEAVGRAVSVAGTPRMGTYDRQWIRTMLTLLDLSQRAALPRDSLARRLAELWHLVGTTPTAENRLRGAAVDSILAAEARSDWAPLHPEDNRLQLEAMLAFDAFRSRRPDARVPLLLLFVPEDHVTTAEAFREFAAATGADTVAYPSACGHSVPLCEPAAIGAEVARYLEDGSTAAR